MTTRLPALLKLFPGTAVTLMMLSLTTLTFTVDASLLEAAFSRMTAPFCVFSQDCWVQDAKARHMTTRSHSFFIGYRLN